MALPRVSDRPVHPEQHHCDYSCVTRSLSARSGPRRGEWGTRLGGTAMDDEVEFDEVLTGGRYARITHKTDAPPTVYFQFLDRTVGHATGRRRSRLTSARL